LDPEPIFFPRAPVELFLVQNPAMLNANCFGNGDWASIFVELHIPPGQNIYLEELDYDRGDAFAAGRLPIDQISCLDGAVGGQNVVTDQNAGKRSYLFKRTETVPANLTYVLLSLVYAHRTGEVVSGSRFVRITVTDVFGDNATSVTVALIYVGSNVNRPVVNIAINKVNFVQGQRQVSVTSGSLVLSDADNDFYRIQSATVEIVNINGQAYVREDLSINSSSHFAIEYDEEKKLLNISGPGSEEEYTSVLNEVTYINNEEDVGSLPFSVRVIRYSVYDLAQEPGSNPGTSEVTIQLVNVNDAPIISLQGLSFRIITYDEGLGPVQVFNVFNVSDSDNKTLAGATVIVHRAERGDDLLVTTVPGVTVDISRSNGLLILRLVGNSEIENYTMMVSSVRFHIDLGRPNNMSHLNRYVTASVTDGVLESNVVQVNVTIIPINDPPILQFNSSANPEMLAPEKDRQRELEFKEGRSPVALLPDDATLTDVDSEEAGGATVTVNGTSDGSLEGIGVDRSLATSFGITVSVIRSETSISMALVGNATIEKYKQVLLSIYYYNNQSVEPVPGPRTVLFVVADRSGARSQPATVTVIVKRTNDPVQVDLGVGLGQDDSIMFTEIPKGENGVGLHIVSRPHLVMITNEEENELLQTITIHLRTGGCGKLDEDELVYLLSYPDSDFEVTYTNDLKGFTVKTVGTSVDAARVREVFETIVTSALYINLAEEPSAYCGPTKNVTLERYVRVHAQSG
jgi:hypothetical protein